MNVRLRRAAACGLLALCAHAAASGDQPDWRGLRRDTTDFLGYQVLVTGALYLMPESVTNWSKERTGHGNFFKDWPDNVSHPRMDPDDWWLNYLTHPYWGAAYYVRGRERGLDRHQAFWYSALLSTLYEYGLEACFEPVSIQDMIVTPVFGSLLGEFVFVPLRQRIRARPGEPDRGDRVLLALTDPLGTASGWARSLLGHETRLSLLPVNDGAPGQISQPYWQLRFEMAW